MQAVFFVDIDNYLEVEEEEKSLFVRDILEQIGLPEIDDVWTEPILNIESKIELRKVLNKYDIVVLDVGNRELEIYVGDDLIARWNRPKYKLQKDLKQVDPRKQIFYEMTIDCVSIFDEGEEENGEENGES